jgi:hypothetical protein
MQQEEETAIDIVDQDALKNPSIAHSSSMGPVERKSTGISMFLSCNRYLTIDSN